MATIHFKKAFTMSLDEVRNGIEQLGKALEKDQGMKYSWENDNKVVFQHKAAKGYVAIKGNEVELEMKLGMLYAAMAPLIKSKISEMAEQYIV